MERLSEKKPYRGRLAPTPSGFLHAGHAATFKTAWMRARANGGTLVLRIEDIDSQRCRPEYAAQIIPDLWRLALDWDEGPDVGGPFGPYVQSERTDFYVRALETLRAKGLAYPSRASRSEIRKLGRTPRRLPAHCNPDPIFPPELRGELPEKVENPLLENWRFRVPDGREVSFNDGLAGPQSFVAGEDFGDFLVWRKSGGPSYELAVVADDIAMAITEVVRGEDLLASTARQILLYEALGAEPPEFAHCPLALGPSGEKLSKSVLANEAGNPFLIKNMPPSRDIARG